MLPVATRQESRTRNVQTTTESNGTNIEVTGLPKSSFAKLKHAGQLPWMSRPESRTRNVQTTESYITNIEIIDSEKVPLWWSSSMRFQCPRHEIIIKFRWISNTDLRKGKQKKINIGSREHMMLRNYEACLFHNTLSCTNRENSTSVLATKLDVIIDLPIKAYIHEKVGIRNNFEGN
jgi:hypothetical protein